MVAQAKAHGAAAEDWDNRMEECMKFIGFKMERISPECVEGRFVVTTSCCQPFGVLHGGISAMVAESLASRAAVVASGFQRVAGVQLSINHMCEAPIGTEVFVSAKPAYIGKKIHVWNVTFFKVMDSSQTVFDSSNGEQHPKLAVSRVTIMAGLTGEPMNKLHARL